MVVLTHLIIINPIIVEVWLLQLMVAVAVAAWVHHYVEQHHLRQCHQKVLVELFEDSIAVHSHPGRHTAMHCIHSIHY
jgi:hypothetical protein